MVRHSARLYSTLSVKAQTVLPKAVREHLGVGTGDKLEYVIEGDSVRIMKMPVLAEDDPFASFTEWASEEDDKAFADL
jgi:antitoxin PrlF